jgi:hypothetical protein
VKHLYPVGAQFTLRRAPDGETLCLPGHLFNRQFAIRSHVEGSHMGKLIYLCSPGNWYVSEDMIEPLAGPW